MRSRSAAMSGSDAEPRMRTPMARSGPPAARSGFRPGRNNSESEMSSAAGAEATGAGRGAGRGTAGLPGMGRMTVLSGSIRKGSSGSAIGSSPYRPEFHGKTWEIAADMERECGRSLQLSPQRILSVQLEINRAGVEGNLTRTYRQRTDRYSPKRAVHELHNLF